MSRQHELASFWRLCFERSPRAHEHVFSDLFNAASDVEALLWLHYGVELDLYPPMNAQAILEPNRGRLIRALEMVMGSAVAQFFPPALATFLGESVRLGGVFDIRYTDRMASDLVNTVVLDMLFHEVARACSNQLSSVFSDLMTFGTDDEWQGLMQQNANPEHVLNGTGEKVDILSAGYFASLDHMGAMNELLQYCGDESTADRPALRDSQGDQTFLMVGERIRSIHAWRVKLDDPTIRKRFISLTNRLSTQLESDPELRSSGFNSDNFFSIIQSLSATWIGDYGFTLGRLRAA